MNNIIILGEEYWFNKPNTPFVEATYLLNYLEYHRNKNKYNYIILQNPLELIEVINKTNDIKAILLFQDVLSDSYLNNKTILEMYNYLNDLNNSGIVIYPPPKVINNFGSKKYNLTLNNELSWASLPHTKIYFYNNYNVKDDNKIFTGLYKNTLSLWKIFTKVVIKKGYSYEGQQVKFFDKNIIKDFYDFRDKAKKLDFKNFWGVRTSSQKIDKGTTRYYIIQGYNNIVNNRENEYRIFFHNGKAKFIAKGDEIPNTCIVDELEKPLQRKIIKFAKKLFKSYLPLFWKESYLPILFRIDVSYAIDPEFQDKYSIKIKGFDTPVRLYANELEIDPTSFFYNEFICKDKSFNSQKIQENMAKYIHKFIKKL